MLGLLHAIVMAQFLLALTMTSYFLEVKLINMCKMWHKVRSHSVNPLFPAFILVFLSVCVCVCGVS